VAPSPKPPSSTPYRCRRCGATSDLENYLEYTTFNQQGLLFTATLYECKNHLVCRDRIDEELALVKIEELELNYQQGAHRHYIKSSRWDAHNGFTGK
jgi:hypothetical protein